MVDLNSLVTNTTITWSIKRVILDMSNAANLVSIPNLDPPRTAMAELRNITDFDVNQDQDFSLIGNTSTGNVTDNQIYSKSMESTFFSLIPIPVLVQSIKLIRFYFVIPPTNNQSTIIDNSINIGYVTDDNQNQQQLMFTGLLAGAIYPVGSTQTDYRIVDVSIGSFDSIATSDIWMSVVGVDNPITDTSYLTILAGTQFQLPGYIGQNSILYTTPNATYTQSDGTCTV
jgi:hypothetical protein